MGKRLVKSWKYLLIYLIGICTVLVGLGLFRLRTTFLIVKQSVSHELTPTPTKEPFTWWNIPTYDQYIKIENTKGNFKPIPESVFLRAQTKRFSLSSTLDDELLTEEQPEKYYFIADTTKKETYHLIVRYLLDNQTKTSHGTIDMAKSMIDKCEIVSFREYTGLVFLICLTDNENYDNSPNRYELVVFQETKQNRLDPVFTSQFYSKSSYGNIGLYTLMLTTRYQKYYLFTNDSYIIIEPNKETNRLEQKRGYYYYYYFVDNIETPINVYKTKLIDYPPAVSFSPGNQFVLYSRNSAGGVINIQNDQIIDFTKSCFQKTDKDKNVYSQFMNNSVDPLSTGPYKTINPVEGQKNTYEQTFCSGGGCAREGVIKMSVKQNQVVCDIKVKYETTYPKE